MFDNLVNVVNGRRGNDLVHIPDARHDLNFLVVLILNLADDLFENIFQCDDAHRSSVFIHHDCHLIFRALKLPEQFVDGFVFCNVVWLSRKCCECLPALVPVGLKDVLSVDDTDNVVKVLIEYRIACISFLEDCAHGVFHGQRCLQSRYFYPRHHDLFDDAVVEFEDILDKFAFAGFDGATLFTFCDDEFQFLFCMDGMLTGWFDTNRVEHDDCQSVEQCDERLEDKIEQPEWQRYLERCGCRKADGQRLGSQFAKDNMQDGDDHEGDREGDPVGEFRVEFESQRMNEAEDKRRDHV